MEIKKDHRCKWKGAEKKALIVYVGIGAVIKNFAWYFEKFYVHISILIAGRNLKRKSYHQRMHFTANWK